MNLGARIKELREFHKLDQGQLGEKVGMSQVAISKIERGLTLEPGRVDRFADALQTTIDYLRSGKGVKHTGQKYPEGAAQARGGMDDAGYKGKRRKVSEMLDEWETLSAIEQDEFLAIAMIHKKESDDDDRDGDAKRVPLVQGHPHEKAGGGSHGGASRSTDVDEKGRKS